MSSKRILQLASGLGWYVFFDILLRTMSSALSVLSAIESIYQRLGAVASRGTSIAPNISSLTMEYGSAFALATALIIGMVSILLISLLLRSWSSFISITRQLIEIVFIQQVGSDDTTSESDLNLEKQTIKTLFGSDLLRDRYALVWRFLRSLMNAWATILILQLLVSISSALFPY